MYTVRFTNGPPDPAGHANLVQYITSANLSSIDRCVHEMHIETIGLEATSGVRKLAYDSSCELYTMLRAMLELLLRIPEGGYYACDASVMDTITTDTIRYVCEYMHLVSMIVCTGTEDSLCDDDHLERGTIDRLDRYVYFARQIARELSTRITMINGM